MSYALKNRSLLSLDELSARDMGLLLNLARSLKRDKAEGHELQRLRGLHIAALVAADASEHNDPLQTAAAEEGAMVVRIIPRDAMLGADHDERGLPGLLGRLYDAIEVRGMAPAQLREFAGQCSVPVYHNVSDATHPTRVVADLMTMQEQAGKPLADIALGWLGDPRGERAATLLHGALLMGLDIRVAASPDQWPVDAALERLQQLARAHAARLSFQPPTPEALAGCDFCYGNGHAGPLQSSGIEPTLHRLCRPDGPRTARAASPPDSMNGAGPANAIDPVDSPVPADPTNAADPVNGLRRAQADNRLHAVKALLVATLA